MKSYARSFFVFLGLAAIAAGLAILVSRGKGWPTEVPPSVAPVPAPLEAPGPAPAEPRVVRPPTVAGQFYPGHPEALHEEVKRMLGVAPGRGLRGVRAVLVPHAGYVYSGEVAAAAFREVAPGFRRVFVLAANHDGEADFAGVSVPEATHYAIPGGEIPLDPLAARLRAEGVVGHVPAAHAMHMVEVELPFLLHRAGWADPPGFALVPMVLGRMDLEAVRRLAEVLDRYADPETLYVFSVDLSHYHPDAVARALDREAVQAVLGRDIEALGRAVTDGNHVLQVLVALAGLRGWEPTFLMERNSGDAGGDRGRVVGYAAIAFHEPLVLEEAERRELLAYARRTIETRLREGAEPEAEAGWLDRHPIFRAPRGVFVTLEREGRLRGCIGDILSRKPLHEGVRDAALAAAFHDPRFRPVEAGEMADLDLTISILTYPGRVEVARPEDILTALRPGQDGVILVNRGRQSTFLPQVWEDLPEPEAFLEALCRKQGSPPDAWRSPETAFFRYGAYVFGEE